MAMFQAVRFILLLLLALLPQRSSFNHRPPLIRQVQRSRLSFSPVPKDGETKEGGVKEAASVSPPITILARDILLIAANVVDTLEDVLIHLKRYLAPGGVTGLLEAAQDALFAETTEGGVVRRGAKRRVVVVGSGWAAHALIKIIDTDIFEVIVISPRPYFIFTPMLTSASVGTVEVRSIVEPIRAANPLVDFLEAEVVDADPTSQTVVARPVQDPSRSLTIEYDHLVFAAGAVVNDFGMAGVREHTECVKEVEDVKRIRSRILDNFERASIPSTPQAEVSRLLSFAVVGGGPTGVEFCGELEDFISSEMRRLYPRLMSKVKVRLITSAAAILNAFDSSLQEQALVALRKRGVDVTLNARVTKISANSLEYSIKGGQGSQTLDFGLCVWAAGTGARDITKRLGERLGLDPDVFKADGARLRTDEWMRLESGIAETKIRATSDAEGEEDVPTSNDSEAGLGARAATCNVKLGSCFALGDCAALVGGPDGPLPQSAQVAAQQGAYLARLLNRQYDLSNVQGPVLPRDSWKRERWWSSPHHPPVDRAIT